MNATQLAKQVRNVFSLPEIVIRINEILSEPDPDIGKLEALMLHDPALTAKLLKFVNSSYFGFSNKIDTVSRAIAMLGFTELKHLVMGVSVTAQFKNIPSHLVDMDKFWYHSVVKGMLAKILANYFQNKNAERFYIAGLLSNLGKLIFYSQYPQKSEHILALPDQSDTVVMQAEKDFYGFDSTELCAELLKEWKLPAEIWELVYFEFDPLNQNAPKNDACILHIAGKIANTVQPQANQTYELGTQPPDFNPGVLEHMKLPASIIESATAEALLFPFEILSIINPGGSYIF